MGFSSNTSSATMKVAMLVLFTVLAVSSALDMSIISYDNAHADKDTWRSDKEVMSMFEQWLVNQGKVYGALGEKKKRFQIFKDNLRFIDEHNSLNRTYKLGLTPFTDLTNEEFRAKYFGTLEEDPRLMSAKTSNHYAPRVGDNLPASVDWRTKGAVTPVKNQGHCQSCWAFAVNGAVEGINKIVTGSLVSLSEQELVDCNQGCDPAYRSRAFQYVIDHGITAEADYPYTSFNGVKGICDRNKINPVVTIEGYAFAPRNDEAGLKKAVANQPVSSSVEASPEFQNYVSGVFTGSCGTSTNHAILIVGYGSENGQDYWIIKNSWTSRWGENGFMKLQRNVNKCGIASQPIYPIKKNGPMKPSTICNDDTDCIE